MTNILKLPLLQVDFETGSNEDWLDSVAFYEEDGTTPISIVGIAFRMQLRAKPGDATVHLEASTANTRILIGGVSSNVLAMNCPAFEMNGVFPGAYVFDLVATADGHSRRVAVGSVTILQGVTR